MRVERASSLSSATCPLKHCHPTCGNSTTSRHPSHSRADQLGRRLKAMNTRINATFLALTMIVTGLAVALPPYIPNGGTTTDVGRDLLNPCNNGGPSAAQELGYNGNSAGTT